MNERPERTRHSTLTRLLSLAAVLLMLAAAGLAVWYPYWRTTVTLQTINRVNGVATTDATQPSWLTGLVGELHWKLFERIVWVDLVLADLGDDELEFLEGLHELQVLLLYGPGITDQGVERLKRLPVLEDLYLIHCPNVSPGMERELIAARPGLNVHRRGAAQLGVSGRPHAHGCQVDSVLSGRAADQGGIQIGDVIVELAGRPTPDFDVLVKLIALYEPGDGVDIALERGGRKRVLPVVLGGWRDESGTE